MFDYSTTNKKNTILRKHLIWLSLYEKKQQNVFPTLLQATQPH